MSNHLAAIARAAVKTVLAKERETAPADRYAEADDTTRAAWNRDAHDQGISTVDYLKGLDAAAIAVEQADAEIAAVVKGARR